MTSFYYLVLIMETIYSTHVWTPIVKTYFKTCLFKLTEHLS
jgi:hypothetical protein